MNTIDKKNNITVYNESEEEVKVFSNENMISNAISFILENKYFIISSSSDVLDEFLISYEGAVDDNSKIYKKVVDYISEKDIYITNDKFKVKNKGSIIINDIKVKDTDFILIIKEGNTDKLYVKNYGLLDIDLNSICYIDLNLENSWAGEGVIIRNLLDSNKNLISIFYEDEFGVYKIETNCRPINDDNFELPFKDEVINLSSNKFLKLLIKNFRVSINDKNDNSILYFYDFFDDKLYKNAKYLYENFDIFENITNSNDDAGYLDDEDANDSDDYEDEEYSDYDEEYSDEDESNFDSAYISGKINYEDIKYYKDFLYFPLLENDINMNNNSKADNNEK